MSGLSGLSQKTDPASGEIQDLSLGALFELLKQARRGEVMPAGLEQWARAKGDPPMLAAVLSLKSVARIEKVMAEYFTAEDKVALSDEAVRIYDGVSFGTLDAESALVHKKFLWTAHTAKGNYLDDLKRVSDSVVEHNKALEVALELDYCRGVVVSRANLVFELLRMGRATDAAYHSMLLAAYSPEDELSAADQHEYEEVEFLRSYVPAAGYVACDLMDLAVEVLQPVAQAAAATASRREAVVVMSAAIILLMEGRVDAGRDLYESFRDDEPGSQWQWFGCLVDLCEAMLLAYQGRIDQSLEKAEDILGSLPHGWSVEFIDPRLVLVAILALGGRYEAAIRVCDETPIWNESFRPRWLRAKGECLVALGRFDEALGAFRSAEQCRQVFDLDASRFFDLSFPTGVEPVASPSTGLADLYARDLELRDLLGHDIRGLFTPVLLSFELAKSAENIDLAKQRLTRAVEGLTRMSQVPMKMRMYSTLIDGSAQPEMSSISLGQLIAPVVRGFRAQAAKKAIVIEVLATQDAIVTTDEAMLSPALVNLLSNAIKFSPPNQTVKVGWEVLEGSTAYPNGSVEVFVEDAGPGLTADEQESIFRDFNASAAMPTAGETSTGFGLQIVAGFVDAIGGMLAAGSSSELGGARFSIKLALDSISETSRELCFVIEPLAGESEVQPAQARSAKHEGLRVLVFDDDPLILASVRDAVTGYGAYMTAASDYHRACELVTSQEFDLFLFDVMVDGEPLGLELAELAATVRPETTLALMSGVDVEVADYALIRKPIGYYELSKLLGLQDTGRYLNTDRSPVGGTGSVHETEEVSERGRLGFATRLMNRRSLPPNALNLLDISDPKAEVDKQILSAANAEVNGEYEECLELAHAASSLMKNLTRSRPVEIAWLLHHSAGRSFQALGDHGRAKRSFQQAATLAQSQNYTAGQTRSAIALSKSESELGDSRAAVEALVEVADLVGADRAARAEALMALGEQLLTQGAAELAIIQLLGALRNIKPLETTKSRRTLFMLAQAFLELGDLASARVTASHSSSSQARSPMTWADEARHQIIEAAVGLAGGHPEEALRQARESLALATERKEAEICKLAYAVIIEAMGQLEMHERIYAAWASRPPESNLVTPRFLLQLARSCEQLGDYESAVRHESRAYALRKQKNRCLPELITLIGNATLNLGSHRQGPRYQSMSDDLNLVATVDQLIEAIDETRTEAQMILDAAHPTTAEFEQLDHLIDQLVKQVAQLDPKKASP